MIPVQEKRFEYKGFSCVILFMPGAYRCGYVGLPKRNRFYGKDYDDIPVDCHCGLTYSNENLYHQSDENTWWIGFDCAHGCDGYDTETAKRLFADDKNVVEQLERMEDYFGIRDENPVRTLEYCEEQCKSIVEQVIEKGEDI